MNKRNPVRSAPLWLIIIFMMSTQAEAAAEQAEKAEGFNGHHFSYGISLCHDQAREDLLVPFRWAGVGVGIPVAWSFVGEILTVGTELSTLRHLLTMRSGIAFDNDDFSVELHIKAPADPVAYILDKPLYSGPGEKYYYRDCDPHLLSALVHHVTGKTLEQWAILHLFPEIGITGYVWLEDPECTTNAVEVLPGAWIDESTSFQTETDFPDYDYGYYWWTVPELGAITAWGHGGNFIFIVPEKDLVIVMISLPDVDDDTVGTVLPEFIPLARLIKEACP